MKFFLSMTCLGLLSACGEGNRNDQRNGRRGRFAHKFSSVQECQIYFDNKLGCLNQLDSSLAMEALRESLRQCQQQYREANQRDESSGISSKGRRGRHGRSGEGHGNRDHCGAEDSATWIQCLRERWTGEKDNICSQVGTETDSTE